MGFSFMIKRGALRIVLLYLLVSLLWITFSDQLLFYIAANFSQSQFLWLSTAKGYAFVVITTLFLYYLIHSDNKKLEQGESQYRNMYEANPIPMWIYNEQLKIISVNDAAVANYGYTREEFMELSILDIRPPEDAEKVIESAKKMSYNQLNVSGNWRHIKKSGELLHVNISSHRIIFNNKPGILVMARNMTEVVTMQRKLEQANHELVEEKRKLKETQLISGVAGWEFYPDTQKLIWTDEVYEITGVARNDERPAFDIYIEHIFPEDRRLMLEGLQALISLGVPLDVTHRIRALSGETRFIRQLATIESGSMPLKLIGSMQDITKLKQLESERDDFRNRLETTLNSINDAYFALDKDMVIIGYNQAFKDLIGSSIPQMMGENIFTIIPKHRNRLYPSYQKALEDRVIVKTVDYSLVLDKWISLSAYPTEEGVAVYFSDVTEDKIKDARLKEALERYDLVAQATRDVIYDLDIVNDQIIYNTSLSKLVDIPYEDIQYNLGWWRSLICADDLPQVISSQHKISSEGKTNWSCEYRIKSGHNQFKYVMDQGYFIYNEQMKPVRLIGVIKDIDELKRSIQENKRQNELLKQVAWTGSHQIRKPVATMLGLMNLADIAEDKAEIIELLPMLQSCVQEMDDILLEINDKIDAVVDFEAKRY
ncbi:PAS domain-containing protein [Mucilaginibacter celer]|uniref:histidine kinase n=1 Tax=Mucilaginibacter celer TaxID=2305508 RepID=A0A494VUC7_9SPHI|nr:PAS domain-containing protein [Mucilaginibacter celer]AYL94938.1 PAS domain S-box protein [Mucilaginibacter celer]